MFERGIGAECRCGAWPALTVCQPWAWAIVHGPKRWENRTWRTSYRGPLLIHAGSDRSRMEHGLEFLRTLGLAPRPDELVMGAIIGCVELAACVRPPRGLADPFLEGPWCWLMVDPRPIDPIPWTGRRMLFDVPEDALPAPVSRLLNAQCKSERSQRRWKPEP